MGIETALLVAAVGSAAVSAAGQVKQGLDTKQADLYQGRELTTQGELEKQAAGAKISDQDYAAVQTMGRISANAGAAGVTPGGSVALAKTNSGQEAQINDMYTRYSGNLAAMKDVYAARQLKFQGGQAAMSGIVGGATTLTSAITDAYYKYKYGLGSKGTPVAGGNLA
jgi:hypothetical protein